MIEPQKNYKGLLSLTFPFLFCLVLVLIALFEKEGGWDFSNYGILPREFIGLRGIVLAPLIHGNFNHLFNNIVPLFILGWALFYFYSKLALRLFILSYLLAGFYTWISARYSYHIGASGLVYALFGFLFVSGFLRKINGLIALSFLTAFLYGSLIWGILPWDQSISWEGHFWGLFIGVILAFFFRKKGPQPKRYSWELEEEDEDGDELEPIKSNSNEKEYVYHYQPTKKPKT